MNNFAIIVAAGTSTRFGKPTPKQYCFLNGKMILDYSLESFIANGKIDKIQVVIAEDCLTLYQQSKFCNHPLILPVVYGGTRRQDSVFNGLQAIQKLNPMNVLIHDAARPFVSQFIINDVIEALKNYEAVDIALSITDTLKSKKDFTLINRDETYATQTPQGFSYPHILDAYKNFSNQETHFTDDITIALQANLKIVTLPGERKNFKITTWEDMEIAEKQIENTQPNYRTGFGFDVHQLEKQPNSFIRLAGIEIPSEYKVIAHSDGDVVLHALMDAILGAIGEEDIGHHFPPSDDKWKGIHSNKMLEIVLEMLGKRNGKIVNVDITVTCEQPRLTPYKSRMKEFLASTLAIPDDCISVKATTTEKMGFIGRGEGIAAFVNCLIKLGT